MSGTKPMLEFVNLKDQYNRLRKELDEAVMNCLASAEYINGKEVGLFSAELADYTGSKHIIPCANGTDALQIALMALDVQPGDEIIVPSFTYFASAEVIGLLKLRPVMVEVDPDTFTMDMTDVAKKLTSKTKAIIPVHLYGQCCDMETLLKLAEERGIPVIEDGAQSIGATYTFQDGSRKQSGTMGMMGTTSFFPSKNLGCYGDGGAIYTQDDALAVKLKMIANHGQRTKYIHEIIGVNSRLDTIQAAILRVKLKHLTAFKAARNVAADRYDSLLKGIEGVIIPGRSAKSEHAFHQYTIKVRDGKRDALKQFLSNAGIPTMIYYPTPVHRQGAFAALIDENLAMPVTDELVASVLSLPMHTELNAEIQEMIAERIRAFFN